MPSIYIYKYNNYYNRQVKSETSLSNYGTAIYIETNVNFNPNDDVNAQQLVGRLNNWYTGDGDYFIYSEDGQNITSRWFILDATRVRQGQYLVTLRRDVVVDNYNDIIEAPMFIEKGYVQDNNPLIFNNENMGYNQIKTSEILLENRLKTPWVVCYLSRYHTAENGSYEYNEFSGSFTDEGATVADYELSSLSSYKYYYWSTYKDGNKTAAEYRWSDNIDFSTYYNLLNPDGTKKGQYRWRITSAGKGASDYQGSSSSTATFLSRVGQPNDPNAKQHWQNMYNSYLQSYTTNNGLPFNSVSGLGTANGYNELQAENGKIIKVGSKYYRISSTGGSKYDYNNTAIINKTSDLGQVVRANLLTANGFTVTNDTVYRMDVEWPFTCPTTSLVIEEISNVGITYDIKYTGAVTKDSAYEIIATPLKDTTFVVDSQGNEFRHSGSIGLQWFQDIINKNNGAGKAYDIQIVPYINFDSNNITTQTVTYATRSGSKLALAIKLTSASFNYSQSITVPMRSNIKIGNEVDVYRFCSPNGVGAYEFSPYKNGGLSSYEADVTLIPFNPYIKVHPTFSGLYGNLQKDDFRGLICGGDFSLPILNDKWSTYELNNKYYQQQFNRNIESQEYNNSWALGSDIVNAITGVASGAAAGAVAGSIVPGLGTAAGAVVGGIASAIGGAADIAKGVGTRNEELQRQKDQFGYQLGTIKAQANTLVRTTSYNISNKYFPYIEYYTASPEEIAALEYKLKYNGMTINVIGKIPDYLGPNETYIQGKPIRLNIENDNHMAEAISYELQQGVYIP